MKFGVPTRFFMSSSRIRGIPVTTDKSDIYGHDQEDDPRNSRSDKHPWNGKSLDSLAAAKALLNSTSLDRTRNQNIVQKSILNTDRDDVSKIIPSQALHGLLSPSPPRESNEQFGNPITKFSFSEAMKTTEGQHNSYEYRSLGTVSPDKQSSKFHYSNKADSQILHRNKTSSSNRNSSERGNETLSQPNDQEMMSSIEKLIAASQNQSLNPRQVI